MRCNSGCTCGRHTAEPRHAYSEEFRQKISETSKGRKQSPEQVEARIGKLRKHGYASRGGKRSPEYRAWDAMKQRCLNPNANRFEDYGGRGITVCDSWMTFDNFLADMGEKPEPKSQYSLDRIGNDGNYEPGNTRWATRSEQQKNRPRFNPVKRLSCNNPQRPLADHGLKGRCSLDPGGHQVGGGERHHVHLLAVEHRGCLGGGVQRRGDRGDLGRSG